MKATQSHNGCIVSRLAVTWLIAAAVLLPMGMVFLFVFGRFFSFFGDVRSALVLDLLALTLGLFWVLSLVALLLCVALVLLRPDHSVFFHQEPHEPQEKEI